MIYQSFVIPIIKVTDSCNFTCKFCYYAQHGLKSKLMSVEDCKNVIREVFDYNIERDNKKMRIIFHGGEPLLQLVDFYREVIAFENELVQTVDEFVFYNSIQTNGYLIDDVWINFFKANNFDVGISIDGPEFLNCHYGNLGVKICTKKVLDAIQLMNRLECPYGIISVITDKHTKYAKDLYDFCVLNNIKDLSLNYCYNSESDDSVDNSALIRFMKELFDLYYFGSYGLNIREFNEMIAKIMGYCSDTCATCDRKNCGQYISFDIDKNVFFCDTGYDKKTAIGNLHKTSLAEIIDSQQYLVKLSQCRQVYEDRCLNCDVKEICGGGCHRYDIIDSDGKYSSNYFCLTHQSVAKYVRECLANDNVLDNKWAV